jgi:hypothetical protein
MLSSVKNDECSYNEQIFRSMGPGLYNLNTYGNDCEPCSQHITPDPYIRYQKYGSKTCPPGKTTNDESELRGLNYKNSNCSNKKYYPGSYNNTPCQIYEKSINCSNFTEDTRLSNNASNLRGTGINRFIPWFAGCNKNPQDYLAIEQFNHIPINVKKLFKENHIPCLEKPQDQTLFMPVDSNFNPTYKPIKNDDENLANLYIYGQRNKS